MFGENLCLTRRIQTHLSASSLELHDEVENLGWYETPHMYLDHINAGFPVVDDGSELILPSASMRARDESARAGLETWNVCQPPVRKAQEQVLAH